MRVQIDEASITELADAIGGGGAPNLTTGGAALAATGALALVGGYDAGGFARLISVDSAGRPNVRLVADPAGNYAAFSSTAADGMGTSGSGAQISNSVGRIYNGSTFDRARGITSVGADGVGAAAVGIVGQYSTVGSTLTSGQYGGLQVDNRSNLKVTLFGENSAAGLAVNNASTDAFAGSIVGMWSNSRLFAFNGSTFDRMRGDTEGLFVKDVRRVTFQSETTTPLSASATFTGTSRDALGLTGSVAGATPGGAYCYFNASFRADVAATDCRIEGSNNNSDWFRLTPTQALTAGGNVVLQVPVMCRYHRAVMVNGGAGQANVNVNTSYTAA